MPQLKLYDSCKVRAMGRGRGRYPSAAFSEKIGLDISDRVLRRGVES